VTALLLALHAAAATPEAYDAVSDIARVFAAVLKDHLHGAEPRTLARRAIDAMLGDLDPWTRREQRQRVAATTPMIRCLKDRGVVRLVIPRFDGAWAGRWLRDCPALDADLPVLIDLRGNPGGSIADAMALADLFVAGGAMLVEERRGIAATTHKARPHTVRFAALAVLIDQGTGSAAELVAAVLRNRAGATLLGVKTMGKATVQRPIILSDGATVWLTSGRLRLSSGARVHGVGVSPDEALPAQPTAFLCGRAGRHWSGQTCLIDPP
jgi:hypothetical protein